MSRVQLFEESPLQPLSLNRARPGAGLAFEKHRVSLPGDRAEAQIELFERTGPGGPALRETEPGKLLIDRTGLEELPAAHLAALSEAGSWASAWLAAPQQLWLAHIGPLPSPLAELPGATGLLNLLSIPGELRPKLPSWLGQPAFEHSVLLADPTPELLARHAPARMGAPLFALARGAVLPLSELGALLAGSAWLLGTHRQALPHSPLCLYSARPLGALLRAQVVSSGDELVEVSLADLRPSSPLPEGTTSLHLDGEPWVDEAQIALSPQLESLSLRGIKLSSFSVLARLPGLESLNLSRLPFSGLAGISQLASLRALSLLGLELPDLAFLSTLPSLRELELDRVTDPRRALEQLSRLPLASLVLELPALDDLSPLAGMRLERLSVHGANLPDLSVLSGLPSLRELSLERTRVRDPSALAGLPHVKVTGQRTG